MIAAPLPHQKIYERVCPVCGAAFATTVPVQKYCSPSCTAKRRKLRAHQRYLKKIRQAELADRQAQQHLTPSEARQLAIHKKIEQTRQQNREAAASRRCCDCGKPTNNYRCAACWRKRGRYELGEEPANDAWFF